MNQPHPDFRARRGLRPATLEEQARDIVASSIASNAIEGFFTTPAQAEELVADLIRRLQLQKRGHDSRCASGRGHGGDGMSDWRGP